MKKKIADLITLCGEFPMPVGEVELLPDGFSYTWQGLGVVSQIKQHASGVTLRCDRIKNLSDSPITLRAALSKFPFFGGEYEVYTQYSEWCNEGIGAWQPLVTEVFASNDDIRMNVGANPFVAIWNKQTRRGTAFHIVADSTWQFRVRKHFYHGTPKWSDVTVELGISERNFVCTLLPGEELQLPEILFYEFRNQTDMDAYKLHRYCNEVYPARSMPVVYNSWLSRYDDISYDLLFEQLEVARDLGVEYFVIDAGWFGAPREWMDSVGDWEECTHCSMRGRMKEFADKVRAYGLKFGLWFEVERASEHSRTVADHPDYYIHEDGHCFVDFANEAASNYIFDVVSKNIEKYGIEFIKFDFNAPVTFDSRHRAFLDYFKGYRKWVDRLRTAYPSLYMENCASGGLRMALANLRGFDSFWMSDSHSLYAQLDIYKSTLLRMPCRALERWITIQSLDHIKGRSREMILMSGDAGWHYVESVLPEFLTAATEGGPMGITCNITALTDNLKDTLRAHFAQYKQERDFWANAECRILTDTPTALVLQFNDADFERVKVRIYIKNCCQAGIQVYPIVPRGTSYTTTDGASHSADALDAEGIEVFFGKDILRNAYAIDLTKKK